MQQTTRHAPTSVYKAYRITHSYDGLSRRVAKRVRSSVEGKPLSSVGLGVRHNPVDSAGCRGQQLA